MGKVERTLIPKQPGSQYTNEQIMERSKYSDEDRRRAVIEYYIHGTQTKVAEITGIPRRTISDWTQTEWFVEQSQAMEAQTEKKILAKNREIIDASQAQLLDRVENGDFKLVKTKKAIKHDDGSLEASEDYELKRVPMPGRDLNITSGTVQDKRRTQLNLPTSISSSQNSQDQLKAVMDDLLGAAKAYDEKRVNSIKGECIEIGDEAMNQSLQSATKKN